MYNNPKLIKVIDLTLTSMTFKQEYRDNYFELHKTYIVGFAKDELRNIELIG